MIRQTAALGLAGSAAGLLDVAAPEPLHRLAWGQSPRDFGGLGPERTAVEMITEAAQRAIDRGLQFLAQRQQEDGSFGSSGYARNAAVCALGGMAFMAAGSMPGRGPYGGAVRRAVDFVLEACQENGFISIPSSASHGPMYDHGFATMFLAETYGMFCGTTSAKTGPGRAVDHRNAERRGGWRYQPQRRDADISVTICQVMALRAARNAGLYVPNETIDRCIEYVKKSQNDDGGFMYMLQGGQSAFPRSAAGVVALYSAGIYEGPEIEKGPRVPDALHPPRFSRESHYFYGHYYACQAMWHAGGRFWEQWYPAVRDELVSRQRDDGSWMDAICPEYGAAMACITLQMPNNYLPIFQR